MLPLHCFTVAPLLPQVQSIVDACELYLFETATQLGADSSVVLAVFDLAEDLHRACFTEKLACHFAAAAQRDVAHAGQLLRHMLRSACFSNSGTALCECWQHEACLLLSCVDWWLLAYCSVAGTALLLLHLLCPHVHCNIASCDGPIANMPHIASLQIILTACSHCRFSCWFRDQLSYLHSSICLHMAAFQFCFCGERVVCDAGLQQLQVLRSGFQAAWDGQGPEVLLLHVLVEVYDVINPEDYEQVLDAVAWGVLQQEEVMVLVHWCLQLPQDHPFTHGLQAKVLSRVAQQISGEFIHASCSCY